MQLLPCVLLGDFGVTQLADTITTEQRYRWSTTDATNFNIDHSRAQALFNRKSLRIATTAATAAGDNALYGVSGTDVDKTDIMNAFGNDVNDLTWCTNLGCWMYHTDDVYNAGDPDEFKMVITDNGTDIDVYWTSDFDTVDKWIWVSGTPGAGSFSANGDNIEQWGYKATAAFTASSYFYLNSYVAYRTTLSTASDDYTHTNGIKLDSSSYIPTGWNSWRVTGNIVGDHPMDLAHQLHMMETVGLAPLDPIRRPTPKYQALADCDNIKTYLMLVQETLGPRLFSQNSGKTVTSAIPGIVSNVSTEWVAPSKEIISFSFDFSRFAGV
jgi:hypothetical protein